MDNSNILHLPFRRTHNVSLSEAIKSYISTKYDQHPDMFQHDLQVIDQLRHAAVHALEPHTSGVKKLQAYAAQLVWMGGKFPIDIGCDFTWYPSLGYNTTRPLVQNNLRFELANILFNLAAMYSQLALSSNRSTSDGLKASCNYFCLAAGTLAYIKTSIVPDMRGTPPEDMDPMTLESLETLMLAQAQECFWQKAVKDGLKDASIAKLAAKVSDLYSQAGDWGVKSDCVMSEWIHHMNAKHHHFAAAAQYRAACDCLEKRKYGEEVARLRDSLNCVNEALKESRYVNKAVLGDLNGLKTRVSEDLKRAEKDNDTIYLIPELPKSELKTIDRVGMAVARVPKEVSNSQEMLGDHGELGKPLFTKLVPYSVHVAASIYADRKDRLVNESIISQYQELNQRIHELLVSLNLPGSLQALEKPLGIPPGLQNHAEDIRQLNGVRKLHEQMSDTEKVKSSCRQLYQEGVDLLRTEAAEDEAARRKYGTERWNRAQSVQAVPKVYGQVNDTKTYLEQAEETDKKLQRRLRENESLIRLLAGTDRDLEDYVPSSRRATMTAKVEREASSLRASLNECNRLESRRKRKTDQLRQKAKEDEVEKDLLREASRLEREYPMQTVEAAQFEAFFDKRLQKYDPDQQELKSEEREQGALLSQVAERNTAFRTAKRGDNSSKEREEALQNLDNAYLAYKEIMNNLNTGRKFYNDLNGICLRFRDDCRNFTSYRRSEAQNIEADLSNAMAGLQLQHRTSNTLQQMKADESRQHQPNMVAQRNDPMPAPVPQRANAQPPAVASVQSPVNSGPTTWTPDMPIVFGNAGPGPKKPGGTWDASKGLQFQ